MPEILGVSGSGNRGHISGLHSEKQRQHGHDHKDHASLHDISKISAGNTDINDLRHLHGDQDLHQHFKDYKDWGQHRLFFVFPD